MSMTNCASSLPKTLLGSVLLLRSVLGLADPVHAAHLTVQPPDLSPPAFIRLAAELQDGTTHRLPAATTSTVAPDGPSTTQNGSPWVCFSLGLPAIRTGLVGRQVRICATTCLPSRCSRCMSAGSATFRPWSTPGLNALPSTNALLRTTSLSRGHSHRYMVFGPCLAGQST